MVKYIVISEETLARMEAGKYVDGSIHKDKLTGELIFRAFNRKSPVRRKDRVICQLEHGWLKESAERIKFYSSVKKSVGVIQVGKAMGKDLNIAVNEMIIDKIIN